MWGIFRFSWDGLANLKARVSTYNRGLANYCPELKTLWVAVQNFKTRHGYDDESGELDFQPLTAAQAQALRERNPALSPWRLVGWQSLAGVLVALAAWGVSGQAAVGGSALYGAVAVILPTALLVRALSARLASRDVIALSLIHI